MHTDNPENALESASDAALLSSDFKSFINRFETALRHMLDPEQLGTFRLVLANSLQDAKLRQTLRQPLNVIFTQLKQHFQNRQLRATADDLAVFSALVKSGPNDYQPWSRRLADSGQGWQFAMNPLRGHMPQRTSGEKSNTLFRNSPATEPILCLPLVNDLCTDRY